MIKQFAALAYLPPEDVPTGFELLTEAHGEKLPIEFLIYFERTWIGRRIGRGPRLPCDTAIPI